MDIAFFVAEDSTHYVRFDEEHVQRAHRQEEIVLWLEQTGFQVLSVTDDYTEKNSTEKVCALLFALVHEIFFKGKAIWKTRYFML